MKKSILCVLLISFFFIGANAQIRFYADYNNLPFTNGSTNNFKISTGVKLDPNKELIFGLGLRGRFNPQSLDGSLRFSQSAFSLGFNYYKTRRLYANVDLSLSFLNDVIVDLATDPFSLKGESYLDYKFNIAYIVLRRFHLSTGMSILDFSSLILKTGDDLLATKKIELNISLALRVYLFQIKT